MMRVRVDGLLINYGALFLLRFLLGLLEVKLPKMKSLPKKLSYFDTFKVNSKMAKQAFVFRKIKNL